MSVNNSFKAKKIETRPLIKWAVWQEKNDYALSSIVRSRLDKIELAKKLYDDGCTNFTLERIG